MGMRQSSAVAFALVVAPPLAGIVGEEDLVVLSGLGLVGGLCP